MTEHGTTNRQPVLYRVLRNRKLPPGGRYYDVTTVEAEGLSLTDARALSDHLQSEEAAAKPRQTSWTFDIFFIEREDVAKSAVGMSLRVKRSRRRTAAPAATKRRTKRRPQGVGMQMLLQWR
jgi:hypothetical protein